MTPWSSDGFLGVAGVGGRADLETPYGKASSAWTKNGTAVTMEVLVPPNTTATIEFPDGRPAETVGPGPHHYVVVIPKA